MKAAQIIFIVLDLLACLGLIVTVMMQESKSKGLGVLSGDSGATDTFYGKARGRTKEGVLKKLTTGFAIAFAVFTLVLYLLTGRGA
ncbi:MAG: preprotein translocase subunit SecG [Clostridiaceae bacterium]|nr:preprotein translocase subunit SecG [Clostridiaceae bacterium]